MEGVPSKPNVFAERDQEIQDLLKRLNDATSKLKNVKSEREKVELEVIQCREELDRRSLLLLPVEVHEVYFALMELEDARKRKQALMQHLQHLNTPAREMKRTVGGRQKRVKAKEKKEEKLKVRRVQRKKSLDDGLKET